MTETSQVDDSAPRFGTRKHGISPIWLRTSFMFQIRLHNWCLRTRLSTSIVAFTHQGDIERVHMHLEMSIGKPVELLVSPPEDVVKGIKRWELSADSFRVERNFGTEKVFSDSAIGSAVPSLFRVYLGVYNWPVIANIR